jgi:hypothetical protein
MLRKITATKTKYRDLFSSETTGATEEVAQAAAVQARAARPSEAATAG